MFYKKIELRNFRNYEALTLELSPHLNIFVGQNGEGKTNFLESIYLLSRGKSFRPGSRDVLLNRKISGVEKGFIRAGLDDRGLESEVRFDLSHASKSLTLNGKRTSFSDLSAKIPIVLFSPESLAAIKEGPEERRKLLDEALINLFPDQAVLIENYAHALKNRNALLKKLQAEEDRSSESLAVLESLTEPFLNQAAVLTYSRVETLRKLLPLLKIIAEELFFPMKVDISVDYLISSESAWDWDYQKVLNALNQRANQLKSAEIQSGSSLVGPHKHDIRFNFNGEDSRTFCSQGQQRLMILAHKMALVLAHRKQFGRDPLILLDDVMSELDIEKRENLVRFLALKESQIILTTTELSLEKSFGTSLLKLFTVSAGKIQE